MTDITPVTARRHFDKHSYKGPVVRANVQFQFVAIEMGIFHREHQKEENSVQCGVGGKEHRDIIYIYIYIYYIIYIWNIYIL